MIMKTHRCSSIIIVALLVSMIIAPINMGKKSVDNINGTPTGWSDAIPLCDYDLTNQDCALTSYNDRIHVIWVQDVTNLIYRKSNDGGRSWNLNVTLDSSPDLIIHPDISLQNDNVQVVWNDYEGWNGVYYRNSTDGGDTWNPTERISSNGVNAYGPNIFVNQNNSHIIWLDQRDGIEGEIYYRRSLDGGITFDNGQGLNEDRRLTFSPSSVTSINMDGDDSNISVVWSDERDGDWEIYWMISKDNGATWENGLGAENVGRQLSDDSTTSASATVTVKGSIIHITWVDEEWPGPVYRLYYRNSTNNGLTWNPIQLLTGPVPGINSPDIDVQGNNISVVWDDERDDGTHEQIYYKNSTDGGITWSVDLRLTYNLSREARWPRISIDEDTRHIIWWDKITNINHQIMYKRTPDFPETTPPSHTNEIPLPDSFKDAPGTNISVHVTDLSGVNASTTQLWVNGSLVSHTLTPITDGYNVSWISGGFGPGVITCRIVAEDTLGNALDYTWNFTVLAIHVIPLSAGWNLISLPLEQVDTSVPNVLASINGKWDVLKYYDTLDKADPWKTYRVGSSMNDLTVIDNTMGFWLHATMTTTLTVRGSIPTYTTIPLYAGWNLVGYPTQTAQTVGNALWGTGADKVATFDPISPYIKEVGATYVMKPGEGYWVHVTADSVWTVSW